ncbi:MAG: AraC family transcriptional regulator [Ectothiorhodospiraceae bacterium]|nr:AraC family transcriptional regulator [Ectothiorhodospiraceae bacterium]
MTTKKNKTNAEYLRRINKAIEYIANNIDQNLSLDKVASASHFSPFHFHRIFHGLVGETVNDFVSRKRLEKAAITLISKPTMSVTEVAEIRGFSSSANFSKAFKLYFGVSPSQLRNPHNNKNSKIGKIYSKYGKAFNTQDLYSQFVTHSRVFSPDKLEEMLMNVKIEALKEKKVAYLTAPNGYDLDSIFETWDKITNWAESKGIDDPINKRFAICHDNPAITPTDKCRYDASIEINTTTDVIQPYSTSIIPSGKYGIAYYKGPSENVSDFYRELYANWLPVSGFEPDDFPPVAHYLNDSRKDGFVEMEVHIKLLTLNV